MKTITGLLSGLNDLLYTRLLIFLLAAVGLSFTVRTGFVQLRRLGDVVAILREPAKDNKKQVSSFQA
ncbi:MAG: sodium:alanine symporter family protein, partial [Butyricicoccus pullicaecorum]|nr:sodium:alanine symporter family protein [Butyricicoccus pullicaecorum]